MPDNKVTPETTPEPTEETTPEPTEETTPEPTEAVPPCGMCGAEQTPNERGQIDCSNPVCSNRAGYSE